MHLKPTKIADNSSENRKSSLHNPNKSVIMAATTSSNLNEDNGGSNSNNNNNYNKSNNNNTSNNNNEDNVSSNTTSMDEAEIKLKKQTLEQRKLELERLLSEKNWLLQQIQKQETQILNGNYEYITAKEILAMLALQYKQEHSGGSGGGGGGGVGGNTSVGGSGTSTILRRKITGSKEKQYNNNNNRQSEISNRSSEYDNYPPVGSAVEVNANCVTDINASGTGNHVTTQQQQQMAKNAMKKRVTPTPTMPNVNYTQTQRQQILQQQMLQNNLQYAALLQHPHYQYQVQQQQQQPQAQQQLSLQSNQLQQQQRQYHPDVISLYSMNSANVATLRQQHVAPQQQPVVMQCDRYYLSPTHQSYDGGFIKSSQNIKKYVSPIASPTQHQHQHYAHEFLLEESDAPQVQHAIHLIPSQQKLQRMLWYPAQQQQQEYASSRHLDAISLAPSYISVDGEMHNVRWRSQSNLPPASSHVLAQGGNTLSSHGNQDIKSHSSDMLASNCLARPNPAQTQVKAKTLDEISISSLNSETQKTKSPKPKQWVESSLDGPVIRSQSVSTTHTTVEVFQPSNSSSVRFPPSKAHVMAGTSTSTAAGGNTTRDRAKLSSQSMSSARHYSMSSHKHPLHSKLLADDDGRYAKLSQSTSYLNSMEPLAPKPSISAAYHIDATPANTLIDMPAPSTNFTYLPPKPNANAGAASQCTPPPPPRPPPVGEKVVNMGTVVAAAAPPLSPPDIRIESPKNMTVVQQATFQPYKEETKPFEMSDFYKYSTKFRQKDTTSES